MKIWDLFCRYANFNPKEKENIRDNQYIRIGLNDLMQIHKYEGLSVDTSKLLELILITKGFAVLGKNKNGEVRCGFASLSDGIDDEGRVIVTGGTTINGESLTDCCLIRNTYNCNDDYSIMEHYAYMLSKVDFAQDKLVQKSVCNPIPLARTQRAYEGIKEALKKCDNDDIFVMKLDEDNDRACIGEGGYSDYDVIEFTDVVNTDKFKYLSAFHDDLTRRAFFLYGHSTQSPTKQAQTNDSELENRSSTSRIYIQERFDIRKMI